MNREFLEGIKVLFANLWHANDAAKIRAQKKAVYDSGLTSWMFWDAGNKYTREAYEIEQAIRGFYFVSGNEFGIY